MVMAEKMMESGRKIAEIEKEGFPVWGESGS